MGFVVQNILGDSSTFPPTSGTCVWIVFRRDGSKSPSEYHLQGIALTEKIAVEMCIDETYFYGPIPVNVALPHKLIQWIGCKFPKKNQSGFIAMSTILIITIVYFIVFSILNESTTLQSLWSVANVVVSVFSTFIILRSKQREEARTATEVRANALQSLLSTKELQIVQLEKEKKLILEDLEDKSEELEAVKDEYKAVVGIKIYELVSHNSNVIHLQMKLESSENTISVLKQKLSTYEEVHITNG